MSSDEEKLRLEEEKAIELFKIKKLITSLQRAKGNGTSMISCVPPPPPPRRRRSAALPSHQRLHSSADALTPSCPFSPLLVSSSPPAA